MPEPQQYVWKSNGKDYKLIITIDEETFSKNIYKYSISTLGGKDNDWWDVIYSGNLVHTFPARIDFIRDWYAHITDAVFDFIKEYSE